MRVLTSGQALARSCEPLLEVYHEVSAAAVQGTMTELDKGIKLLSGAAGSGNGEGSGSGHYRRELPSLPTLFATPVEALEDDDIDYMTDE
jgi:hypothetical protein